MVRQVDVSRPTSKKWDTANIDNSCTVYINKANVSCREWYGMKKNVSQNEVDKENESE